MKTMYWCVALLVCLMIGTIQTKDEARTVAVKKSIIAAKKIKQQQQTFMDCLPSTIMSGIAGVVTGSLTRYVEQELQIKTSNEFILWLIFFWWLEHKARHSIVNGLAEDCAESEIPHKRNWMHFSAWLSSWTAYLRR